MPSEELDRVDMGILHLLQKDARNVTTTEIGERVGLSSSAVATRISALEDEGVITGYAPVIDYEKVGLDQHVLIRATAPVDDRESIIENVVEIPNVTSVIELVTDDGNVIVEVVSPTQDEIEAAVGELNEIGIEVLETEILKTKFARVFNHFGERYTAEGND